MADPRYDRPRLGMPSLSANVPPEQLLAKVEEMLLEIGIGDVQTLLMRRVLLLKSTLREGSPSLQIETWTSQEPESLQPAGLQSPSGYSAESITAKKVRPVDLRLVRALLVPICAQPDANDFSRLPLSRELASYELCVPIGTSELETDSPECAAQLDILKRRALSVDCGCLPLSHKSEAELITGDIPEIANQPELLTLAQQLSLLRELRLIAHAAREYHDHVLSLEWIRDQWKQIQERGEADKETLRLSRQSGQRESFQLVKTGLTKELDWSPRSESTELTEQYQDYQDQMLNMTSQLVLQDLVLRPARPSGYTVTIKRELEEEYERTLNLVSESLFAEGERQCQKAMKQLQPWLVDLAGLEQFRYLESDIGLAWVPQKNRIPFAAAFEAQAEAANLLNLLPSLQRGIMALVAPLMIVSYIGVSRQGIFSGVAAFLGPAYLPLLFTLLIGLLLSAWQSLWFAHEKRVNSIRDTAQSALQEAIKNAFLSLAGELQSRLRESHWRHDFNRACSAVEAALGGGGRVRPPTEDRLRSLSFRDAAGGVIPNSPWGQMERSLNELLVQCVERICSIPLDGTTAVHSTRRSVSR